MFAKLPKRRTFVQHNGALSSSGSPGCAFRARSRIPAWVPPRAEGPPGPGKLQFPACAATDAPAYRSYRAGAGWFKALCWFHGNRPDGGGTELLADRWSVRCIWKLQCPDQSSLQPTSMLQLLKLSQYFRKG
ncbi:uncharacterized protein LOC111162093 [Enhydra lutris kenyoni]|uniref:Uncharacterized protein LOC111162093 n=1 Tax=Enhydra lutris kenyoni TaxID=391180 RepID=A0A2Y9LEJ2_ENHLU|nr:uncharacterized protein LOC111162093 [Enhydra lutris kenyoni]